MKTHTSRKAILFRSLLLLPLLSALIYGFSTKEVVEIELSKKEIQSEVIQQKATKAEIAEYNKLAIKYNAVDIEKRIIKKNDLERLEIIYKKMTDEQKANAEPFPECIPPPPPTSAKSNMGVHNMRIPKSDSIVIYYKEKVISLEEADDLVEKNKVLSMNIIKSDDGKSKVFITEKPNSDKETSKTPPKVKKGEISDIPPPPPAPKVKKGEKSDIPPPPPPPSPKVIKGEKSDIPPPPPPPNAPKVKKGEKSNIPPPPPPPPSPKVMKGENSDIPPPPPPNAPKVKKGEKSDIPPPPPPAPKVSKTPSADNGSLYTAPQAPPTPNPDPVEYIKELGKRGATFYIGPHKYNTDEAIELVRKSKDATIDISKYPEVHLGGC